ncbi:uncharacterized protein LOC134787925 [Penaeus indicus]|uniref:uncharacterized protein LOC134787925 n=1 Tax=Penaeus indicus TaxID=29960 RepID=UPI00300D1CBC
MTFLRAELLRWAPTVLPYLILTSLFALSLVWFFRRQQKVALIEKIPGPKALPLLGNALEVNVEPRELFQVVKGGSYIWSYHTALIRIWAGPFPLVQLFNCKTAEVILSSQKHLDKSRDYTFLHPWLGTGLLTSTGSKWHSRRKLLTPAFHFKILEDFVEIFNNQSIKMVKLLEKKAGGECFDIFPYITLCTLDIICETAMGCKIGAQDNSESDYVKAVYRIGSLVQHRQARPWLQPDILFKLSGYQKEHDACLKLLHDFSYDTIRTRRREYQESKKNEGQETTEDEALGKKKRLAFLDLLLEYSDGVSRLTDEDIREEVDTFMFEGHDTTAAAINWTLYLLGCHPEIQARVHEELDGIFGDSDRPVTMADLREMKLMENCIKEALRLFPSVPFIARELREDVVINDYHIPSGTTVLVVTYRLHRDPEQFPNPEVFDPDRFLPENCKARHPYAYVPFSAGPRNCIGQKFAQMEERIVLSNVLRHFRVESTIRREDLRILGELILRPENGNPLRLFPRKAHLCTNEPDSVVLSTNIRAMMHKISDFSYVIATNLEHPPDGTNATDAAWPSVRCRVALPPTSQFLLSDCLPFDLILEPLHWTHQVTEAKQKRDEKACRRKTLANWSCIVQRQSIAALPVVLMGPLKLHHRPYKTHAWDSLRGHIKGHSAGPRTLVFRPQFAAALSANEAERYTRSAGPEGEPDGVARRRVLEPRVPPQSLPLRPRARGRRPPAQPDLQEATEGAADRAAPWAQGASASGEPPAHVGRPRRTLPAPLQYLRTRQRCTILGGEQAVLHREQRQGGGGERTTILSSSKHIDKSWDYTLFRPWLGEGLVTSAGVKWHTRRKMLTPAFHFKILEDFVDVFTAQAATLVEKLKTKADGRPFDIYNDITLCALDIICETAMGRSINAQRNSESEIVKAIHKMGTLIQFRQFRPWLHPDFAFRLTSHGREQEKCLRVIHGLATDTIELRRKARQEEKRWRREEEWRGEDDACGIPGQKTRHAFLDLLLEYSEKDPTITDEDIRDEVNTFMFAGHDTTSAAMNWFLYAMGSHPDAQERVFEEIEAVMQGSDRAPSASDLREMKYLELCLKETLRLFPPIPMIIRELKEDAVISSYSIPAGTSIVVHVFRLHRDPEQFPDPEVFDPNRFLPQNSLRRHNYAFAPFSAGPRNCIGQKFSLLEMKAILCSILRTFRVESVVPRKDLKLLAELILLPKGGNLVRLFPRGEGDDGRRG